MRVSLEGPRIVEFSGFTGDGDGDGGLCNAKEGKIFSPGAVILPHLLFASSLFL